MTKQNIKVGEMDIELTIHTIDDEVSEVYASWDGMEIEFAYDVEDMMYKLNYKYGNG